MKTTEAYEARVKVYMDALTEMIHEHYRTNLSGLALPKVELVRGSAYDKVIKIDNQRSVHSFIERKTGNILKAASWNAPLNM